MDGYDFASADGEHSIYIRGTLQLHPIELFADNTIAAFEELLQYFPISSFPLDAGGELYGYLFYLPVADLETVTLWCDERHFEWFAASINQILDLYARHLNERARREQKARVRQLYWQHRGLKAQVLR